MGLLRSYKYGYSIFLPFAKWAIDGCHAGWIGNLSCRPLEVGRADLVDRYSQLHSVEDRTYPIQLGCRKDSKPDRFGRLAPDIPVGI